MKRVVVTGIGAVTPIGNNAAAMWQAMVAGKSGVAPITQFDATLFRTRFAGEVKDFDPSAILDKKEARRLDRYAQFTLVAADEALRDAGLLDENGQCTEANAGVIWGSGMGGLQTFENESFDFAHGDGTPRFNPFFIPKVILSIGAGHISLRYGVKGMSFAVSSACASSTHAIIQAFDQIRLGHADVIITGGADADVTQLGIGGFNAMHALSTHNDSPETASRPFSASRDGFVLGEGAGCLILEELEHAKARGAKIYAEVAGGGMTSDAYHLTAPDPNGDGARRVMEMAIADAGIAPTAVDYINTHGTSTPLGDIAELRAIKAVFGEHAYQLSIDSTKSMTGHLLGATGAVEALACVLALRDGIVPPTINHAEGDEDAEIDYRLNLTFNKAQYRSLRYALTNTFGFGGHNASMLFKKWEE